jgi:hypothetical protein
MRRADHSAIISVPHDSCYAELIFRRKTAFSDNGPKWFRHCTRTPPFLDLGEFR